VPGIVQDIVRTFPWPKSMRWAKGSQSWVRPLHSIICVYSGLPVEFEVDMGGVTIPTSNVTKGHRFLAPDSFSVMNFEDYKHKLKSSFVILDSEDRKKIILEQISKLSSPYSLKEDIGLLEEVAGLVEWPTAFMGSIDPQFMDLPREVLTTSMRVHQRYFSLENKDGSLAPKFVIVSNTIPNDGGKTLVSGNERVLRARLSDAAFFYDQDKKQPLESFLEKLKGVVFHGSLGTMAQKVDRLESLSIILAPQLGCDVVQAQRAARLAKADLATHMVGEFPELQGIMGRYYSSHETQDVQNAIGEHYSPKGPGDKCPSSPLSVLVALADKIDTLVGFFTKGIQPTGSKDPFALRRCALGIIRLILENDRKGLSLIKLFEASHKIFIDQGTLSAPLPIELMTFMHDRLKVYFRDLGFRHDCVAAILDSDKDGDLTVMKSHLEDLDRLLKTEDGINAIAGYKRALNIVRIEEKKNGGIFNNLLDKTLLLTPQEISLYEGIIELNSKESFSDVMKGIGRLRSTLDDFFENITVNDENTAIRVNRLTLLRSLGETVSNHVNLEVIQS
jgi:glycyl-tRNA synthetase beta chain